MSPLLFLFLMEMPCGAVCKVQSKYLVTCCFCHLSLCSVLLTVFQFVGNVRLLWVFLLSVTNVLCVLLRDAIIANMSLFLPAF